MTRLAAGPSVPAQGWARPNGRSWAAALWRDWGRPIVATSFLLFLLIARWIFGIWHASMVMSPEVREMISRGQAVDIVVQLSPPPERFHLQYMQNLGQVMKITGRSFFLKDVAPEAAKRAASEYWVSAVSVCGAPCR